MFNRMVALLWNDDTALMKMSAAYLSRGPMDTECDDLGAMLTSPVLDQTRGRRAVVLGGTHQSFVLNSRYVNSGL